LQQGLWVDKHAVKGKIVIGHLHLEVFPQKICHLHVTFVGQWNIITWNQQSIDLYLILNENQIF